MGRRDLFLGSLGFARRVRSLALHRFRAARRACINNINPRTARLRALLGLDLPSALTTLSRLSQTTAGGSPYPLYERRLSFLTEFFIGLMGGVKEPKAIERRVGRYTKEETFQ